MRLADFEHVIDFPERSNVVYVVFYVRDGCEKPFYVGETDSFTSRMSDYLRASFGAATDFKVGQAICYLTGKENVRIRVGFRECTDRQIARKEEDRIIKSLRKEGVPLLNDLDGYDYRDADRQNETTRVHKFCDDNILNAAR